MKHLTLSATSTAEAVRIPAIGQGTWRMGEHPSLRASEVAALRAGFDLGLTLVDTAEMYGHGAAEEVVAEAIRGVRRKVFLVSKVLPDNASRAGTIRAAEASLRRLGTDHIDLYLLHWPGDQPLEETLAAFEELAAAGKIIRFGLSNFDTEDMKGALMLPGGEDVSCDQVLYNLRRRGIEWNLMPWCRERGILLMAYSPVEQGDLVSDTALAAVAARHDATPAQIALAWTIRKPGVMAIPKSSSPEHLRQNAAAGAIHLSHEDLEEIDAAFPRPKREIPLETA